MKLSFPLLIQFVRFSTIGLFNTVVDFGIYYSLTRFMGLNDGKFQAIIATCISFIIANMIGFFMHSRFTFTEQTTNFSNQYIKYFIVSIVSLLVNVTVFSTALYVFNLNDIIAKIIAVMIVVWFSFAGNKLWAFRT